MRPLQSHFPAHALSTLDTVRKQTKEARVLRRAPAVHAVVAGQHVAAVAAPFPLAHSARRKWVQRFAREGPRGLLDRPRSGRPPKGTGALAQHLNRLVDQDPLQPGALASQWSCRALATVLAQQTGIQLGRASVRCILQKTREAPAVPLDGSILLRLISPLALWHSLPGSTGHGEGR